MARRRQKIPDHENLERWLLTYADLITLLLAFFIIMYSMSQIDAKKFGVVAKELNRILKGGDHILRNNNDNSKTGHGLLKLGDLSMIRIKLEQRFEQLSKQNEFQTEITERGLVIHIMESALFNVGSAELEPRAQSVLDIVSEQVKSLPNHIRVEGHTDDRPIKTEIYPSNWELSSSRATEVVRYLIDFHRIAPERISALGYGEYRPRLSNSNIENRAANRRVDIVILTMELTLKEPSSALYSSDIIR